MLADAGYWNNSHIEALVSEGMQTLVPPDAHKRAGPRPGRRGGSYDFMRRVLATNTGKGFYKRRHPMIEPVFA